MLSAFDASNIGERSVFVNWAQQVRTPFIRIGGSFRSF